MKYRLFAKVSYFFFRCFQFLGSAVVIFVAVVSRRGRVRGRDRRCLKNIAILLFQNHFPQTNHTQANFVKAVHSALVTIQG